MIFLIFYYYFFIAFGIFFVIQEMNKVIKSIYFLDKFGEEEDDLYETKLKIKNNHEKKIIQKYEDKYKIKKELIDDELSQEKLEGLINCFILENTPNGNALILYNHKTSSFIYYSDNSIPYKYLNTLARKYVNTYRCKQLYVNQEKDQKEPEKKEPETEKEPEKKEPETEKEPEKKEPETEKEPEKKEQDQKKQIFAKFKNYNKNTTNQQQSHQQQSHQQQSHQQPQQQEVIANRYTYQGKIANFTFLKKPDKKLVNKKLSLTFSDYKKLNLSI